jgi:predicted GNAT family N-acyltransferase
MLPLTMAGLDRLAAGKFDGSNPDLAFVCRPGECPAGIYIWALFAPGRLAAGFIPFTEMLESAPYTRIDLYTRTVTPEGQRYTESLGFKQGVRINGVYAPLLYIYSRAKPATRFSPTKSNVPLYDSYPTHGKKDDLSVTVARSLDDLMRVINIRSAVYVAEQESPFDEEYDGNDLSAMHLLGYVGDEPAGCLRIRYFADFAKIERLAVLKRFRHTRLAFQLVRAGIELCRKKGYRKLYGHAQKRLVNFWSRFGFKVLDGGKEFAFADFDYVEMVADAGQHPEPIRIGSDPYVIIRPEGRWHMPGALERSASRPVTRPSVS